MAEPVEVAINKALFDRAIAFAATQSPALTISLPNIAFTPPEAKTTVGGVTVYGKWLRATFLPAPSFRLGVDINSNQHYGVFQVDVFYGLGAGELAPKRIAANLVEYFKAKRGREISQDGYRVEIYDRPTIAAGLKNDPWWQVPVGIPYRLFQS